MFACTGFILPPEVNDDWANVYEKRNNERAKKIGRIKLYFKNKFLYGEL